MKSHGIIPPLSFRDERFMRMAIEEAKLGIGKTAPNPAVGAVLVKNGRLLTKGYHHAAGMPHAEIEALRQVTTTQSQGATIYITLEPCSSHGRTPPCTEAIIAAGIKKVIYGATDPDARHQGRAARVLRAAGIEVVMGYLDERCSALNTHWNHLQTTRLPWIIAKAGMSLDGHLDSPPHRRWITSAQSRKETMKLRASVEAILVGGETVRTDDPSLTIRGIKLTKGTPQPWRVVWTRSGDLPPNAKIFTDKHRERTLVFTGKSLHTVLKELGKRGISSVLIEGGGRTLGEAFDKRLIDEIRFYIAPIVQGGSVPAVAGRYRSMGRPIRLSKVIYTRIGSDLVISANVLKKG
ncbi:MAG: bifunctional diaminohydroxyphosphoribosylaminopyrimidine deaminase/5-amino-6-(5-phosphoribosylamino)uracil reductase RibD [bacterium]